MVDKLKQLPQWGVLAILGYIPFHVFIAQWAGTSIGGLDYWKAAKDFIVIALLLFTVTMIGIYVKPKVWLRYKLMIALAVAYALLHGILYLILKDTPFDIAALASTYNNRFIWIFFVGLGAGMLLKRSIDSKKLVNLVLIISTIVCLIGLFQWVLPKDILTYFGYAKELGVKPNFFINEDPAFPRIFSTFKDPNSFGAYLIIPTLALTYLFFSFKKYQDRLFYGSLAGIHLLALYLSFSRAAWVGLAVGAAALLVISRPARAIELLKKFWPLLAVGAIVVLIGLYSVRDTAQFRSIVLKADDKNAANQLDSDEYHLHFIKEGINGAVDKPIGHGPGTAGIVSIQLENSGQLTENYYVQIAYEVGLVGVMIFVAIWALVVKLLYEQKPTTLTIVLLAATVSYALMSMVMHLWTNEAVALTYWGLAGLAIYTRAQSSKTPSP